MSAFILFPFQSQNVRHSHYDFGGASEELIRRINAMPGLYDFEVKWISTDYTIVTEKRTVLSDTELFWSCFGLTSL